MKKLITEAYQNLRKVFARFVSCMLKSTFNKVRKACLLTRELEVILNKLGSTSSDKKRIKTEKTNETTNDCIETSYVY